MYARLAWGLTALSLLAAAADIIVTAQYRSLLSEAAVAVHGFPFVTAAVLGSAAMGALIVSRDERHPIGWLLCVIGFLGSVSLLAEAYSVWVISAGGPGTRSLGGVTGWVSSLLGGQLSLAGLAIMFLLAPDGHLLSRRWRYAAFATLTGLVLCVAGLATFSPTHYDISVDTSDGSGLANWLLSIGFLLIAGGLVASLVSMLLRLRRSHGEQRQQLRLIAVSAALVTVGLVDLFFVQLFNGGKQTWAAGLPLFFAYFCLPILFAVAVLRYRLYDIEVIINRAVILTVGTAFAALGYTGLVVGVGALIDTQTSGFWLSLLTTALVALAFQPLRRRVVRVANRLAFGSRALPYEALSDFSRSLAETPSPETLLPAVAEAAGRAVSASRSTAVLEVPGSGVVSETWSGEGPSAGDQHEVPVRIGADILGRLEVTMPRGRPLRAADNRLLNDLADQAAVAFRNAAMEAQLAEHVAALDVTTHELAESRRRLIEADDDARRLLESAISREVLPDLAGLPDQLGRVRGRTGEQESLDELDRLVSQTNKALDALRELTRGVFPTQLARMGIAPTLRSYLARSGLAGRLYVAPAADRRFPTGVEAAVYFCCTQAVHDGSESARIDVLATGGEVVVEIRGCSPRELTLQAMVDRVEAARGALSWDEGAVLVVRIPLDADAPAFASSSAAGPSTP